MKRRKQATKGRQGKKQAPPGRVDAVQARRAKAGKRERARAKRVAAKAKAGARLRDARDRRRREERRKIEAWRQLLEPLEQPAVHPTAPRAGTTARQIREAAGLSIQALAELSGLTPEGIRRFEASQWGGHYNTFRLICRALRVTVDEFDHWHEGNVPRAWRRRG